MTTSDLFVMGRKASPHLSCMSFKTMSRAHTNSHSQSGKMLNDETQCTLYCEQNRHVNVSQPPELHLHNSMEIHASMKDNQTDANKAHHSELTSPIALPCYKPSLEATRTFNIFLRRHLDHNASASLKNTRNDLRLPGKGIYSEMLVSEYMQFFSTCINS